jgi:sodium-dependent dicarboxylate transporter 2/3/5
MPAGTGPNTVVFGSNRITIQEMARAGVGLKIISLVILPFVLYLLIELIMGIDRSIPEWALMN